MKWIYVILMLGVFGCSGKEESVIAFSLTKIQDTTGYHGGGGMHPQGTNPRYDVFPHDLKGIPEWQDSRLYFFYTDFVQLLYQAYHDGRVSPGLFSEYISYSGLDSSGYSIAPVKAYFAILSGKGGDGQEYMVIDENGNLDFSDDTIQPFTEDFRPVKVEFERFFNGTVCKDSTWARPQRIEWYDSDMLFVSCCEVTTAEFQLGQKKYTCRIEPHSVFYDNSGTWINIISKDTLVRCHPGEYLHLEGNYYKVDSVASDGRYLRMTFADHPENIYSMQEGFRPMPFTARTTEGKEIHFPEDFSGKYVLLDFWSTGCGPCVEEIRHTYPRLYDRFKEKGFEILGIAFNSEDEIIRFKERYPMPWLVISDAQKELQNLYRIQSFPTLVLINPQGTVEIKEEGGELRGHHLGELLENLLLPEDPAE